MQDEKTTVQGNKITVFCVHADLVIEHTTNPPNINTTAKFFHVYVRMLMHIYSTINRRVHVFAPWITTVQSIARLYWRTVSDPSLSIYLTLSPPSSLQFATM